MENIFWPEWYVLFCREGLRINLFLILTGVDKYLKVLMGKFKELTKFQQRFAIRLKIPYGYSKESFTHRSLHPIFKQWKLS